MTVNRIRVGDVELTRVGYADITIDPARVGLSPEQVRAVPWAEPVWAVGDELRAGAAAWVIESGDARIVVDPAQAADEVIRSEADAAVHQQAFADVLAAAGFPRESFTHGVSTHVEGIGMWAWRNDDGSWAPFFPNALLWVPGRDLEAIDAGKIVGDPSGAIAQLRAQGAVRADDDDVVRVTDAVTLEHTGAHAPGHRFVRISSGGEHAVIVGHLVVTPLHLVTGECPQQHPDPAAAEAIVASLRGEDTILVGPLWPAPGAARWDGRRLVPVTG
jgi:hypothetical protein